MTLGEREGVLVHNDVNFSTWALEKAPRLDNYYVSLSLSLHFFIYK